MPSNRPAFGLSAVPLPTNTRRTLPGRQVGGLGIATAAAVGKALPQLPHWRGAVVATYSPTARWDVTLAARYSDRSFATIDNSDHYANTYQGFEAFFVVDAHARYAINDHLAAGVGVTNLGDRKYFLFHPFPQRSVVVDLKYTY